MPIACGKKTRATNPLEGDPQNAADRTQKEAGRVGDSPDDDAAENGATSSSTARCAIPKHPRPDHAAEGAGYEVEARVLAFGAETSMTRALLRFEEQVAERGTGRYVNQPQHDNATRGASHRRDARTRQAGRRRQVYDANQRPIYDNHLEKGEWARAPEAARVVEQERNRELTHAEKRTTCRRWEDIATLARQRTQQPDKGIEAKLDAARGDLARLESSPAFQRAEAFERMTTRPTRWPSIPSSTAPTSRCRRPDSRCAPT